MTTAFLGMHDALPLSTGKYQVSIRFFQYLFFVSLFAWESFATNFFNKFWLDVVRK